MKRILLTLAICATVLTLATSCKKCVKCSYTFTPYGSTVDSTVTVAQECGRKEDRTAYENTVRADAALVGGVVTCDN